MSIYKQVAVRGLKMFYREAGSKSAPTIVLLHGFPSSSHMFRDLIPKIEHKFHVIAPDYIGFGYSDAPSVNNTPARGWRFPALNYMKSLN